MAQHEPSLDALASVSRPWTAQMALDLLPENNGPRIEDPADLLDELDHED